MTRAEMLATLKDLKALAPEQRRATLRALPEPAVRALVQEWWWQAHGGQHEPATATNGAPWRIWAIVAGRGFGKTRAGAEWIWARARAEPDARIALVAASLDEVARVMIEGESGLLALARCDEAPRWIASRGLLLFPSGAQAHAFTAEKPDKLRGPQHHFAWCDELAKWPGAGLSGHPAGGLPGHGRADATWDNLMLGLRLGERPRAIVTTTPRAVPLLKRILALPGCAETRGRTHDNPHLPADFRDAVTAMYGGTRLGRQELEGLLLDDFPDALWTREMLEKARTKVPPPAPPANAGGESHCANGPRLTPLQAFLEGPGVALPFFPSETALQFHRTVIGLDPPASTGGDSCGIIVCGMDEAGVAHVIADLTKAGLSPEAWARRVADAAAGYGASLIVAESNQGGNMIESVLRGVDSSLPIRLVPAVKSKAVRAEPVALRFETGHARLAGHFPELEDQLCALTWSGYQGPGSPDRADAMVWAMTELFARGGGGPRLGTL